MILTTVDQELGKIKLYKDSDPSKTSHRESYSLDFLPPVGVVTNISIIEHTVQYDENTGKPEFKKCRIRAKIKWYNNKSDRFSEEEVPVVALKSVPAFPDFSGFDKETLYYIDQDIPLEGRDNIKINKIPVRIHDLVFKHFYYQFRVKSLFNHKLIITKQGIVPKKLEDLTENMEFEERIPFEEIDPNQKKDDFSSQKPGKWYRITYRDRSDRYSSRFIKVRKMNDMPIPGKDHSITFVEANCLLRDGAIRHFRLDNIISYKRLEEFEKAFCEL